MKKMQRITVGIRVRGISVEIREIWVEIKNIGDQGCHAMNQGGKLSIAVQIT